MSAAWREEHNLNRNKKLHNMSDAEKQDHWKLLASDLGAEVSPEVSPARQPASEEGSKPGVISSRAKAKGKSRDGASPARRSPVGGDWGSLAKQLGIAASESTPAEAVAPVPAKTTEPRRVETPRVVSAERTTPTPAALPKEAVGAEVSARSSETDSAPPTKLPRKRKKRSRRSRDRERARTVEGTADEARGAAQAPAPPTEDMETFLDEADLAPADAEATDSHERTERPERARRGRGRRKKSSRRRPAEACSQCPAKDDAGAVESSMAGEEDPNSEEDGDVGFVHRGIPSWREAVGVVIEANLATRARKGSGESSNRPRDNRGRGGRGRNGATPNRSS